MPTQEFVQCSCIWHFKMAWLFHCLFNWCGKRFSSHGGSVDPNQQSPLVSSSNPSHCPLSAPSYIFCPCWLRQYGPPYFLQHTLWSFVPTKCVTSKSALFAAVPLRYLTDCLWFSFIPSSFMVSPRSFISNISWHLKWGGWFHLWQVSHSHIVVLDLDASTDFCCPQLFIYACILKLC